jgi:hypothetical protein
LREQLFLAALDHCDSPYVVPEVAAARHFGRQAVLLSVEIADYPVEEWHLFDFQPPAVHEKSSAAQAMVNAGSVAQV